MSICGAGETPTPQSQKILVGWAEKPASGSNQSDRTKPINAQKSDMAQSEQMVEGRIMTGIMPKILPLENGDRITRAEFERRYDAMPNLKKAELIEGVVYVGSPVRVIHGTPHALILTLSGLKTLSFCGQRRLLPKPNSRCGRQTPPTQ
ncbi:hypothetical protein MiSe_93000 [Microseira wollei NIES-4236]|uniref:Uma2 family endonuclease n=1 Tax=Microseira wollei NIES-4236 TaxID=2530354 RepID=A0AAV3XT82_9CYAN|nr:hypothetical protein MiSe_93000 [Microseira wollei NIES-4236]